MSSSSAPRTVRVFLAGLGNVGRPWLSMLVSHGDRLLSRHNLVIKIVGCADSSSVLSTVNSESDLSPQALLEHKSSGKKLSELIVDGFVSSSSESLVSILSSSSYDILVESTPTDLKDGGIGLQNIMAALKAGKHVVTANKGPLVVAFSELQRARLSHPSRPQLRFSASCGGALPSINVGFRDLAAAKINRVEAVVNGTTQIILGFMSCGKSFTEALFHCQAIGIAEADPSLDVDGFDSANKLVIIANAVLGMEAKLTDVSVQGIRHGVPDLQAMVEEAKAAGGRVSLLAVAEAEDDSCSSYKLSVTPTILPASHALSRLADDEMCVNYFTDLYGRIAVNCSNAGPYTTAGGMLRDVITIATQ